MAVIGTPKWPCPACTYNNWPSSQHCVVCCCPKPAEIIPKTGGGGGRFRSHHGHQSCSHHPSRSSSSLSCHSRPTLGASSGSQHIISRGYSDSRSDSNTANVVPLYASNTWGNKDVGLLGSGSGGASPQKWACSHCTYGNWTNTSKCAMCGFLKPRPGELLRNNEAFDDIFRQRQSFETQRQQQHVGEYFVDNSGAVGGEQEQEENLCNQLNDLSLQKAASMSAGRPNGNKAKGRPNVENHASKKWKCSKCTYENWPRTIKCAMCHGPRSQESSPPPPSPLLSLSSQQQCSNSPRICNKSSPSASRGQNTSITASAGRNSNQQKGENLLDVHSSDAGSSSVVIRQEEESSSNSSSSPSSTALLLLNLKALSDEVCQIRNRLTPSDWLFLNACVGVVNSDPAPVKSYLRQTGDRARQLTRDECMVLGNPSKYTEGSTLAHLAIRFQVNSEIISLLLTPASAEAHKRLPSQCNLDLAASIREEMAHLLRQHKGDWPCYFLTQLSTFILPAEIHRFCLPVRKKLLDEVVDRDVEKELELESIINWSSEVTRELGSSLYPMWNRMAGDCLLDSVLQATWGVVDRDNTLRKALANSLSDGASCFYERWKEAEQLQSHALGYSLEEEQLRTDWELMVALADQPGKSLEQPHVFALAHILRRPIVVYGVRVVKNFRGENLGFANFEGIYLPLLWEPSFCWKAPIALGYTRGHFSALVSVAAGQPQETGAWSNTRSHDTHMHYLPLVDSEGKALPIHFLTEQEYGSEERLLREYCDCHVTRGGILTAKQEVSYRQKSRLVVQLVDEWLDRFRRMDKQKVLSGSMMAATQDSDIDS